MNKRADSNVPDFFSRRPFLDSFNNEKLWVHMNNLWEDPAEYKILMARRMLNLNYALMQEWGAYENERYLTDGIMSNTAFLLSARKIADRYAYRKRFPRILICDDIMLHGRGIVDLLNEFQKIVRERLAENGVEVSEKQLGIDLYRSVRIYVFARNIGEELLIDDNKYQILRSQILPINQLRELSMQISDYLQNCGVANTSYVLSARLNWHQLRLLELENKSDYEESFQYKGRRQYIFFRNRSSRILETMRICYPSGDPMKGGILTSLPIFGDIPIYSFNNLCRRVANFMERNTRYSQIAGYLSMNYADLRKPKSQLLSFLYSILSMFDFCRQNLKVEGNELYGILVDGDLNKNISNFDNGELFRYEILSLFRYITMSKSAASIMWEFLDQAALDLYIDHKKKLDKNSARIFKYISGPERTDRRKNYEDAEDIFYEVGIDSEYDAYRHIRLGIEYDAKKPSFNLISFRQYMHIMNRKEDSREHSIGCLFGLMDSGLISMNLEADHDAEGQIIRTVLKAGELATFILPRRFSIFIPAFAEVEKHYRRIGGYVGDAVSDFIDYVLVRSYKNNEFFDWRDEQIIMSLKKKKSLLLCIYSAGQSFQDWDIDLRNEKEYLLNRFAKDMNDFTYNEERVRKKYYLMLAKDFIYLS